MTSWAFEMEVLILGWYILVETGSVVLLTAFASLQFIGTLIAPYLGVIGDRVGRRAMLCSMRALLVVTSATLMTFGMLDSLTPYHVFAITFFTGLVRPSDMVMRNSLVGDTMPADKLVSALGLSRMSMDSARIVGAMTGAGLFAALGIGRAYMFVVGFYAVSFLLTLGVSKVRHGRRKTEITPHAADKPSQRREFKEGVAYIWNTPTVLSVMCLAFLVNLTAFPISHGLLPYVAREIYLIDETGLSHLIAGFASGALVGSLTLAWIGRRQHSSRYMLVNILLWYTMLAIFSRFETKYSGFTVLFVMGVVHSMAMVSMSVTLLSALNDEIRGRVMGFRMLCVYGVPIGLLSAGFLIEALGFANTVAIYVAIGSLFTVLIGFRWRDALWRGL